MNIPAQRLMSMFPSALATLSAIMMINAFLKTLSLKAPRNCVRKNGRNRPLLRRESWVWLDMA